VMDQEQRGPRGGIVRHGIEEMPYQELCAYVTKALRNADENGYPVWDWTREAIANDLAGYDDAILACHVNDVLSAVDAALAERRAIEQAKEPAR